MKYICLTAKHHDGFCLWNTAQTPFNTMNTPFARDIVAMLAQACQRRGVPLCLYYSVVDWNHRSYPNQARHHELEAQAGDEPSRAGAPTSNSCALRCASFAATTGPCTASGGT